MKFCLKIFQVWLCAGPTTTKNRYRVWNMKCVVRHHPTEFYHFNLPPLPTKTKPNLRVFSQPAPHCFPPGMLCLPKDNQIFHKYTFFFPRTCASAFHGINPIDSLPPTIRRSRKNGIQKKNNPKTVGLYGTTKMTALDTHNRNTRASLFYTHIVRWMCAGT